MSKKRSHPRSHLRSSRAKTNPRRTASKFPSGVLKREVPGTFDVTSASDHAPHNKSTLVPNFNRVRVPHFRLHRNSGRD